MISREMINQRVVGDPEDLPLQVLQVLDTHDLLLGLRVQDHEITKTKTLHDLLTQILRVALRVLVDKRGAQLLRINLVTRLRRLEDERDDQSRLPNVLTKLITRIRIFYPGPHETHVRDNAQHVILVLLEDADRLLISTGQLDLGTATHTQRLLVTVQRLLGEHLALLEHELIKMRQGGRIETHRILDQHDDLHTDTFRIVRRVHLILNQLNDGEQQLRVTQPAEHIINGTQVLVGHPLRDLLRERGQHHDRDGRIQLLDLLGRRENIPVIHIRHADHQLEVPVFQLSQSLLLGSHLREPGRITQAQRGIFIKYLLIDPPVVLQHESVIFGRDQQHVIDALVHQVGERRVPEHQVF